MSDDTELTGMKPVEAIDAVPASRTRFFASALGKVLLVGCGIAVLLLIAAVALAIVLGSSLLAGIDGGGGDAAQNGNPAQSAAPTTAGVPATGGVVPTGLVQPVPDIENRDVFTPRDPFEPIAAPKIATETPSGTTSANDKTLVLVDITTEDGERKAVLSYSGTQYTLGEGESIPSSPWKVLKINTSSVVMLFGDDRITLAIGQGITK